MPTNSSAFAAMETTNPKYEAIYAAPWITASTVVQYSAVV